jgi:hypothetical protein
MPEAFCRSIGSRGREANETGRERRVRMEITVTVNRYQMQGDAEVRAGHARRVRDGRGRLFKAD